MDEETKKLIEENYALNKANNEMLLKLVKFQKLNLIYKVVYWSIIILSVLGAFYFIGPLLSDLFGVYTGGSSISNVSEIKNSLGNKNQVQDLLKSLQEN